MYTADECRAAIATRKRLLEAENVAYSVSPADGGTSRSVSRIDRDQLMKELRFFSRKLAVLEGSAAPGSPCGGFKVKIAVFPRT